MLAALLIRTLRWMHCVLAETNLYTYPVMFAHDDISDYCECLSSFRQARQAIEDALQYEPYKDWPRDWERQLELPLIFLPANAKHRKDN